jgi:ribosomal protein L37AE/L43A
MIKKGYCEDCNCKTLLLECDDMIWRCKTCAEDAGYDYMIEEAEKFSDVTFPNKEEEYEF